MNGMIGYCGLDCSVCPAHVAKKTNDDVLRKKTAEEWSKQFGAPLDPSDINCDGCTEPGQHIGFCESICEIRKCAMEKKLSSCALCEFYSCAKLDAFLKNIANARGRLEEIRGKG